jgi:hypothetical protein
MDSPSFLHSTMLNVTSPPAFLRPDQIARHMAYAMNLGDFIFGMGALQRRYWTPDIELNRMPNVLRSPGRSCATGPLSPVWY